MDCHEYVRRLGDELPKRHVATLLGSFTLHQRILLRMRIANRNHPLGVTAQDPSNGELEPFDIQSFELFDYGLMTLPTERREPGLIGERCVQAGLQPREIESRLPSVLW